MPYKLCASTPLSKGIDGIKKQISKYYYGSTIILTPVSDNEWSVATLKGLCENMRVIIKKDRYRLELSI